MESKAVPVPFEQPSMTDKSKTVKAVQEQGKVAFATITAGSIGGAVGKVVEYPFDTVKVRLQSQPDHLPLRYTGPFDCFRQSIQQDGFRSLYRGLSAPVAGAAAENASLFYSYEVAKKYFMDSTGVASADDLTFKYTLTAGAISGAVTATILTPVELVKCKMQVPGGSSQHLRSPLTVVGDVFRREGLSGFYRGHLGTFLRETGGTAAWFGAWEGTTKWFKQRIATKQNLSSTSDVALPFSQQLLAGATGGMSYNLVLYPADTIKSKIQTGEAGPRATFVGVGKQIWATHGLKGLYRGCGITVARSAPSSALTFTIVENLKPLLL